MANSKKPNKPRTAEAIKRTADRKVKNAALNKARHEANLALVAQYGIAPRTETKTITEVFKVGPKTVERTRTITKNVRASKLVRAARRHGKVTA